MEIIIRNATLVLTRLGKNEFTLKSTAGGIMELPLTRSGEHLILRKGDTLTLELPPVIMRYDLANNRPLDFIEDAVHE